jgi:hypothetical protein
VLIVDVHSNNAEINLKLTATNAPDKFVVVKKYTRKVAQFRFSSHIQNPFLQQQWELKYCV